MQSAANARIASLSFSCIERYVCSEDPEGHALPLFINGMDENLRTYLEQQGYTDTWTDSAGGLEGRTIGDIGDSAPGYGESGHSYVSTVQEQGVPENEEKSGSVGSGMMYENDGDHQNNFGQGPNPWDVPKGGPWTIKWTLRNRSGQIVKKLEYPVNVVVCEGEPQGAYCNKVKEYEYEVEGSDRDAKSLYNPPPAFPRE